MRRWSLKCKASIVLKKYCVVPKGNSAIVAFESKVEIRINIGSADISEASGTLPDAPRELLRRKSPWRKTRNSRKKESLLLRRTLIATRKKRVPDRC